MKSASRAADSMASRMASRKDDASRKKKRRSSVLVQ